VDFTGYTPLSSPVRVPLREATRVEALALYEILMACRPRRRAELAALWRRHDPAADVDAAGAPARLGAWLAGELAAAGPDALTGPDAARWTGLAVDLTLWLGERLIAAAPQLRWHFQDSHKKSTGYQRAVLTGFTRVEDRHYYVDLAHFVASWAELAARRRPARPDFLAVIEATTLADA
jgi:hypothetical protein